jgi:hypothetical protein
MAALVAAYAVALQALLSAFVPVTPAFLDAPFVALCATGQTGGPSHPTQHELPCAAVCAALGHGIAGPAPPDVAIAYTRPAAIASFVPISDWIAPGITVLGPQAPRGPPLA